MMRALARENRDAKNVVVVSIVADGFLLMMVWERFLDDGCRGGLMKSNCTYYTLIPLS